MATTTKVGIVEVGGQDEQFQSFDLGDVKLVGVEEVKIGSEEVVVVIDAHRRLVLPLAVELVEHVLRRGHQDASNHVDRSVLDVKLKVTKGDVVEQSLEQLVIG